MKSVDFNHIELVVWDVDGTLYSLRRMKWRVAMKYWRETLKGRNALAQRELASLRQYRQRIDSIRLAGGSIANRCDDLDLASLRVAAHRWYVQAIAETGPRAGVTRVLTELRNRTISQAVFSDFEADAKLAALGLSEYFDKVYAGERLGYVKPHPAVLEQIASDFSVSLERVLHIGDRVDSDEVAARAAGCHCLILGRDFRNFESLLKRLTA